MEENKKINKLNIALTIVKLICIALLVLIIIILAMQRFSNNKIAIGGYRIFNVATGSMVPKYEVGDVLIVKEVNIDDLKVGDDITYLGNQSTFAGRVITHQIIRIEETEDGKKFHTKGLANDMADPVISGDQIYGKVVYKCVIISLFTKLMNNLAAFYIIVFIPIGILLFLQIKDRIQERNEEKNNNRE